MVINDPKPCSNKYPLEIGFRDSSSSNVEKKLKITKLRQIHEAAISDIVECNDIFIHKVEYVLHSVINLKP